MALSVSRIARRRSLPATGPNAENPASRWRSAKWRIRNVRRCPKADSSCAACQGASAAGPVYGSPVTSNGFSSDPGSVMTSAFCLKYQIRHMLRAGGGAIVNTASIAGVIADPAMAPYVAAKHGVIGRPSTTRRRASGSTRWRQDWSSHR
ncbi:MAG: SDR family NAD(P)-dependent oxidoreductase [Longimicrobiales bacterium]